MDDLRLILVLIGLAVLVAIYLVGRNRGSRRESELPVLEEAVHIPGSAVRAEADLEPFSADRDAPVGEEQLDAVSGLRARDEAPLELPDEPLKGDAAIPAREPEVVAVTVMTTRGPFNGEAILAQLEALGARHGRMDIFHCYGAGASGLEPLYSVANVVEPGTFDPAAMAILQTPGLALFAQVNHAEERTEVVDRLLAAAHRLADALGGEVCDAARQPLDEGKTERLRRGASATAAQGI